MNFETSVLQVAIEDIVPNRFQPRLAFEDASLSELANSIKQHGIIQPLVLRKTGEKYEIIAGERRYRAATMAGLTYVPAVISKLDDKTSAEVAIAENVQRKELTAIEEAKSYKALLDLGYMSQEQLAKKMGISQSAVANKLRLLNLAQEVQDAILENKISERHARSLLSVKDPEQQVSWLHRIIEERLTVRALDNELRKNNIGGQSMNVNIDEVKQNATDINFTASSAAPVETGPVVPTMPTESIEVGTKTPGRFFNNLEEQEVNMQMTEAINPLSQNNNDTAPTPQVKLDPTPVVETPQPVDMSIPVAQTPSVPETTIETDTESTPVINIETAPVVETPQVQEIIPTIPIATPETVAPEQNVDSLDVLEPTVPTEVVQAPNGVTTEDAKTKIKALVDELKDQNVKINLFEAQNGSSTIYTITIDE